MHMTNIIVGRGTTLLSLLSNLFGMKELQDVHAFLLGFGPLCLLFAIICEWLIISLNELK